MKLPALLEARRRIYDIPDGCFRQVAAFDRALLWQINDQEGDTFKGTVIIKAERTKQREREVAPRGVLVTAGLEALDYFYAHGIERGSIVKFVRLSPWKMPVDVIDGKEQDMQVVRCGDVVAVEDIAEALYTVGSTEVVRGEDGIHRYRIDGVVRERYQPKPADDY